MAIKNWWTALRERRRFLGRGAIWGAIVAFAGGAHAGTDYDLLVNHDSFQVVSEAPEQLVSTNDGPVGGLFIYRTKSKINGGSGFVAHAVVTQKLPASAIFKGITTPADTSCTGQPSVDTVVGSATITCTIATLGTTEIPIDFKVVLPQEHTENKAVATIFAPDNTDPLTTNSDNISRNITTYKRADLKVVFAGPAAGSTHEQGDVVSYQIQVSNTNATYAYELLSGQKAAVRFSLPTGTAFQGSPSSSDSVWACTSGTDTSVTPNVAVYDCIYTATSDIPKNTDLPLLTIPVVIQAASGNTTALASVEGRTTGDTKFLDAYPDNNSTNVSINFTANTKLDMALVKTVAPTILDAALNTAQDVTYTLKATRNSGGMAPTLPISITDTLPAGVTFNGGVTDTGWACSAVGSVVTCTFTGTPAGNGSLADLTFKAQVTPNSIALTAGQAVLKNSATLSVANEPVAGANNTSSADLTISNRISLSTSKAAPTVSVVSNGTPFAYEIKVHNDSDIAVSSTQNVTVIDVLDAKLEYVGAAGSWSCAANQSWSSTTPQIVTCTSTAGIAAKGNNDLTLNVKAHIPAGQQWGTITNKASVSCPSGRDCVGTYPVLTNEHTLYLSDLVADLSITKAAAVTQGFTYGDNVSGSEVVYTLKVKNAVPSVGDPNDFQTAQTVVVTDTITNLLNSNAVAGNHPVTGAPRYGNNGFVEATVVLPIGSLVTADACTYAPSGSHQIKVECKLHNMPVGNDEYTITIKARQFVDPTSDTVQTNTITNTATVNSPDTAEYSGTNNSDNASVILTALTNMKAQIQASLNSALAGQKIDYTLSATNHGPSKANKVWVENDLPLGMIWVSAPTISDGSCTLANGEVIAAGLVVSAANQKMTCTWNAPFNGGLSATTKDVKYALRSADTGYPASVTSSAIVRTNTLETVEWNTPPTDNTTSKTVTLDAPQVNVLINMGHSADGLPINDGTNSQTQYTITVTNSGESTSYATNVVMMDVFPLAGSTAGFDFISIDSVALKTGTNRFQTSDCQQVTSPQAGLRCVFPWLAPTESVDIKFTMKAMTINNGTIPVGTILHDARVSADVERLPNDKDVEADNTVTDRTSAYDQSQVNPGDLKFIDLSINKTTTSPAPGDSVQVGGQISYRLSVKNEDASKGLSGGNAKVRDVLPANMEFVGTAPAGCTYTAGTRTLECTITSLNAGATKTFDFTTKLLSVAAGQTSVTNTATVESLGDPVDTNNEKSVNVPVADLDVGIAKSVSASSANPGQTLTYTLLVKNLGTQAASGVVVTDTLPAGVSFVASGSGCTASGGTVTCNVGNMAGNSQQSLDFTAKVADNAANGAALNNCAKVAAAGDKNPANDESCASTTVVVPPVTPGKGSIACSVFDDLDRNGSRGADELGLAGVPVRLFGADGAFITTTTTDADGGYSFPGLAVGSYRVEVILPTGYSSTGSTSQTVAVVANQVANACFGAVNKTPGVVEVEKTLYEGWDAGASCGTPKAVKELLIVEKHPNEHQLTWCFVVTNRGSQHLSAPVWKDSAYPSMTPTARAGSALPLAPGATGIWYFQATEKKSVVNTVGISMTVTDKDGKPIPELPAANSGDDSQATFGMIYDPPYGVKVGAATGADIINWTMVWVNDNIIAANNVYVSDTVKAPMEFVPGTLSCVGEGVTTPIAGTCLYNAATKTISVRANFGADLGKTVANANNRLFISFHVKVPKPEGAVTYDNQANASWTPPGSSDPVGGVTTFVTGVKIDPIDPSNPKIPPVVLPPGVSVDDPSIGNPKNPENPGGVDGGTTTPVVVTPDGPPVQPPEPPKPPKPPVQPPAPIPVDNPLALLVLALGIVGFMARKQRRR